MCSYLFIQGVGIQLVLHEEFKLPIQLKHELGARRDSIAIKEVRCFLALLQKLFFQKEGIFSRAETAGTLLVHFGTWGHTINRQKQNLAGLHGMHDLIYRLHDIGPDFIEISELANPLMQFGIISVNAVVDNTVQIKVQIIYKNTYSLRTSQLLQSNYCLKYYPCCF